MDRQGSAQRAAEAEELVYGIAYASHDPPKLSEWRTDLRRRVGLIEGPRKDRKAVERMTAALQRGKVVELGPDLQPIQRAD